MKIAIVTGTRHAVTKKQEREIQQVIYDIISRGYALYFGDADGIDEIAYKCAIEKAFSTAPSLFYKRFYPLEKLGRTPAGLAERSTRLVKQAVKDAEGDHILCVGFPSTLCPASIKPAKNWAAGGSGTWSTMALAAKNGAETWFFPVIAPTPENLPWGGTWMYGRFLKSTSNGWRFYNCQNAFAFWPDAATEQLYRED